METHENNYLNRRRPWVAVFLSLVMPGLGQIYCGDIQSGITVMLIVAMCSSAWMVGTIFESKFFLPLFLIFWGIVLLATVFAATDAYRRARRTRYDYKLKEYNHWGMYLMLIWIASAGTIGYTAMIKMNMFEAFRIPVNSMAPTIMAGDRVNASKMAYDQKDPEYGDIVLFKNPENRKQNNIKRVVALGGDTIEVKYGDLLINGQTLNREWVEKKTISTNKQKVEGNVFWETNGNARYQVFISGQASDMGSQDENFGPVTVPPYHCFVMSDNRNHLIDSRNYGPLSLGAINGQFQAIYWPFQRRATLGAQK